MKGNVLKNLLSFFKNYKLMVLIIVLLLVVQAYCDLSLPAYTSDILNIGLQQNGIKDAVPSAIDANQLTVLELMMSDENEVLVDEAFSAADENGIRYYKEESDREAVNEALLVPESVVYQAEQMAKAMESGEMSEEAAKMMEQYGSDASAAPNGGMMQGADFSQLGMAVEAGIITKEQVQSQLGDTLTKLEGLTDTLLNQMAVGYVSTRYEEMGIDLKQLQSDYLWGTGGKMLLLSLLMMAVAIVTGFISSIVSSRIGRDLRQKLYKKVMSFSKEEVNHFSTASLITRSTNDIQQVQIMNFILLRMVLYAPIIAIGGIINVVSTNTGLGWIVVLAIVIVGGSITVLAAIALPKFKLMQKLVDRVNLVSREILTGVMPIRAFSREKHEEERFDKANTDLLKTMLFTNRTMTFMMPILMFVMNGVSVLIVWGGAHGINDGTMQIGDMTAFLTYTMVIIMGFLMFAMVSIMLPRASVAANRIVEVFDEEVVLKDPENPVDFALDSAKGEVRFEHVDFAFADSAENALTDIDFIARPGETTAIIGSTGCGKTTILNLINRFYDVTGGRVTIDGVDVRDMTQMKLHSMIGLVPQKGILFSGTIESNIKYADNESITDAEMEDAAKVAQALEFIESKAEKYGAGIAQGGSNVSGGQKQRLQIARAVAKKPKIFLFDDSFSALDFKTDLALRKALSETTGDSTVIIVAQRISTIMNAEQILVINDGRIAGKGTHKELLKSCSVYQEIAKSQLSEKELNLERGED